MEWRLYFSKARASNNDSTQMEDADVQEIIDDRLEYLLSEFQSHIERFELSNKVVKFGSFETIKDPSFYGLEERSLTFHVNDLKAIGWPDPFPHPLRTSKKHHDNNTH